MLIVYSEDMQYSKDAVSVEGTLRDLKNYLRRYVSEWTHNKSLRWSYNKITGTILAGCSYHITHEELETPDDPDTMEWWKVAPYRNKDWIRGEIDIPTRTFFVNNQTTKGTRGLIHQFPKLQTYFRGFEPSYDKARVEEFEREERAEGNN